MERQVTRKNDDARSFCFSASLPFCASSLFSCFDSIEFYYFGFLFRKLRQWWIEAILIRPDWRPTGTGMDSGTQRITPAATGGTDMPIPNSIRRGQRPCGFPSTPRRKCSSAETTLGDSTFNSSRTFLLHSRLS